MGFISITRTCRPIRLGFLVRPGYQADLRRAIEINTVLWGGIYNPLIPFYIQAPPIWKDERLGGPTGIEILRGYIATFQPDFIVKPENANIPEGIFPKDRTIGPSDVLSLQYAASGSPIRFGLDMMDVYADAYRKVFRFVQRHPRKGQIPNVRGRCWLLGACLWGQFPAEERLAYYKREFAEVFEAERKTYSSIETLLPGTITPLPLTIHKLEESRGTPEPCVFVLDETKPLDLIDFWNLRACGGSCIPLPTSLVEELTPEIKYFMNRYLRKRAVNETKLSYPCLMASRSFDTDELKQIVENLSLSKKHRITLGNYPRLWAKQEAYWDRASPASFHCKEKYEHVDVDGDYLTFDALHPEFAARFGRGGPRWINVININEHHPERLPANVIPDDLEQVGRALGTISVHRPWTCDEGVAVCCEHKDWSHHWELPEAGRIGKQWAMEKGYELVLSDSGRILQSMVNVAGGLFRGRWFANEGIIRALGRMAEGKVVPAGEFHGLVRIANEQEDILHGLTERHLKYFQEKGILSLCMKIQCPHCGQYPRYTLEELAHNIECRKCLRHFDFPVASPPSGGWCYRSIGPFASPGFGQGAYSVFLALRFLTDQLDAGTTCVPSCKLVKDERELEADFICFWHKHSWRERGRHVIFGECKCFGDFEDKDIRRMQEFARKFPGSVMAFCTLKNSLKRKERILLKKFAETGRRPRQGLSWPAPVLILTGNELCVMEPGSFNHRRHRDNATGLARRMAKGEFNMLDLCSASQQEYLGLPSIYEWQDKYYKSKWRRRKQN
ncbi:MAG TPA: hypothetical protein VMW72_16815 [Sedimentisphaerales bacterium]|nr:hypothetical protein [Sedimentisphaerales bacterium]